MKKIIAPLFLSILACTVQAATITVNSTVDDVNQSGVCTLRDAIASVNDGVNFSGGCGIGVTGTLGSSDAIVFDSSLVNATIGVTVPNGIEITSDLVIDASSLNGGITFDANDSNRIFHVTGGDSLSITGVTFRNGNAVSDYGGAIYVDNSPSHTLTLEGCTFENNQASWGGAVFADTATISSSTFNDNKATVGGAVIATNAIISNSTFNDNKATGDVGGSGSVGGAVFATSLEANHLTLLNNTADNSGQALYTLNPATLHNSIIIGSNGNAQCAGNATFTGSYNLEGWVDVSDIWQASANTCGSSITSMPSAGNALNTIIDSTLADNGGRTQTLKLSANSPAIGAADPVTGGTSQMWDFNTSDWADATLDQRGYGRAASPGGRSIGAYERGGTPPSPPSVSGTPIPVLPAPLLLALAIAAGLLGRRRLNRNA